MGVIYQTKNKTKNKQINKHQPTGQKRRNLQLFCAVEQKKP